MKNRKGNFRSKEHFGDGIEISDSMECKGHKSHKGSYWNVERESGSGKKRGRELGRNLITEDLSAF